MQRLGLIIIIAALAGCAVGATSDGTSGPLPFPVERGSALPPPAPSPAQGAPPQGAASGGFDFGQWRTAEPLAYAAAFESQVRQRYASQSAAEIRADLQANGFACAETGRLDCRIEISERPCGYEWYVVQEQGGAALVTGFDKVCVGAG
jgi:hypothetical protein